MHYQPVDGVLLAVYKKFYGWAYSSKNEAF